MLDEQSITSMYIDIDIYIHIYIYIYICESQYSIH